MKNPSPRLQPDRHRQAQKCRAWHWSYMRPGERANIYNNDKEILETLLGRWAEVDIIMVAIWM